MLLKLETPRTTESVGTCVLPSSGTARKYILICFQNLHVQLWMKTGQIVQRWNGSGRVESNRNNYKIWHIEKGVIYTPCLTHSWAWGSINELRQEGQCSEILQWRRSQGILILGKLSGPWSCFQFATLWDCTHLAGLAAPLCRAFKPTLKVDTFVS